MTRQADGNITADAAVPVVLGYLVGLVASIATAAVVVRLLVDTEAARFFVIVSVASPLALVMDTGAGRVLLRAAARGEVDAREQVLRGLRAVSTGGVVVLLVACAWSLLGDTTLALVAVMGFFEALRSIASDVARGRDDYWGFALASRGLWGLLFLAALTLMATTGADLGSSLALTLNASSLAIGSAVITRRILRRWPRASAATSTPVVSSALRDYVHAWREGWPFAVNRLLAVLSNTVDLWLVATFLSPADTVGYAVLSRLVGLVSTPLVLSNQVLATDLARGRLASASIAGRSISVVRVAAAAAAAVAIPMLGFPSAALGTFGVEGSTSLVIALVILVVGRIFSVLVGPAGTALALNGHERSAARAAAAGLVITALFGFVGVVVTGSLVAVACASAAGTIVQNALVWRRADKLVGLRTDVLVAATR